ncbi:unnamed protein product [Mesocestoides corti]|uniref:Potassium channel domain-containing protein n=2 Tax=Mesocestoides corti TaxID=53468 RepID=A0A0R3UFR6_MESCO|nr:unnamed protein product [Mesocestoides corti]
MGDFLERTRVGRPICETSINRTETMVKESPFTNGKMITPNTTTAPTSLPLNTYENLQPPPKPSFNHSGRIGLLELNEQIPAPPKPSLGDPQFNKIDTLIYSTLREFRPKTQEISSISPAVDEKLRTEKSAGSGRFTVTPVPSENCPSPNTLVENISSQGSNDDDDDDDDDNAFKLDPTKFITVPEDLINLDRKSIVRARFRKAVVYAKHALGFIISHIGLSLMVVGYTILGALVFCAVEREKERQVKTQMLVRFNNTLKELMDLWVSSFFDLRSKLDIIHHLATTNQTLTSQQQTKPGLEGLEWYLHGLELSKGVIPKHWIEDLVSENSSMTFRNILNSTIASAFPLNGTSSLSHANNFSTVHSRNTSPPHIANITFLAENVKANVTRIVATYVNQVVHAIKDEGWNGASNLDDINWTFEGGVLFAITVITTIGE